MGVLRKIEFVGVDGGGCIALTALGAVKNGFAVIINESAIGTMLIKKAEKYKGELMKYGASYIHD